MGAGLLAVKSGFILFIKDYQCSLQINTLERERDQGTICCDTEFHSSCFECTPALEELLLMQIKWNNLSRSQSQDFKTKGRES